MKAMLFLSIVFISITILPLVFAEEITREHSAKSTWKGYDDNTPLSWNDFSGETPENHPNAAVIYTWIEPDYSVKIVEGHDCAFTFPSESVKTFVYIRSDKSWVNKTLATDSLLNHEQGHFDIAKIYSMKYENALKELDGRIFFCDLNKELSKSQNISKEMNKIVVSIKEPIFSMWGFTDDHYDLVTGNGTIQHQQERWDSILSTMKLNPSLSLAEASSLFPRTYYINQDINKQDCDILVFHHSCNVSIHTWLIMNSLVAVIVGGLISYAFYKIQLRRLEEYDEYEEDYDYSWRKGEHDILR